MNPYVALYRKYRPGSFAELVGQEPIARTLASAITQQRLAHAYLFCGPRGTGKTSVARILAKSINCQQGPTDFPCGTCTTCLEVTNGTNLDVVEIDAASNNGVDSIRDLQDRVALAPVGGRYKVYIIDEVHMLSQGAFNALLKTLEEPPPNVIFVLATTDPHKVLPTIISRCQRFDFGRIPIKPLIDRLSFVAGQENIGIDGDGLEAIARRANGGLRDALSLLDQTAAMAAGEALTGEQVAASLGLLSGEKVAALAEGLISGDVPAALEVAHSLLAAGHDPSTLIRELMAHFRHLLVLQLAPDRAGLLDVPTLQLGTLTDQAGRVGAAELTWVLEVLNETEGVLRRSPQQSIWLELGLIKLARRPSIPSLLELAGRVSALESAMLNQASGHAPIAVPLPRAVPSGPPPQAPPPIPHPPKPDPAASTSPAPAAPIEPQAPAAATPVAQPALQPPTVGQDPQDGLPPRPPLPEKATAPARPASAVPSTAIAAEPSGGQRPVPTGAWERVREHVRARSMPTAALLDQQAMVDRWESDGAVIIRIAKAYKDIFDRQAAKKQILGEAISAVFGKDAFARLEVGDPKAAKAGKPAEPGTGLSVPSPGPVGVSPPRPASPVPAVPAPPQPTPARGSMDPAEPIPLEADQPPAWLDEYESARPGPSVEAELDRSPGSQRSLAEPGTVSGLEDSAVKLAVDLFNGRVVRKPDAARSTDTPA